MLKILTKNWWLLIIQGLLFVIFGIVAFVNPTFTAATFAIWFAILIMLGGLFAIIAVLSNWKEEEDKWLLLIEGILGVVIGFVLFRLPEITMLVVSFIIAFWFIISGALKIAMAIQLRKEIKGEGWIILVGAISVLFGVLIFARPVVGYSGLVYIIGFSALVIGIILIAGSLKLRKIQHRVKDKVGQLKEELS